MAMKKVLFLMTASLVMGCRAVKVSEDYDRRVDFTTIKTYQIYPEFRSGMGPLDERRLLYSLERQLQDLGWVKSDEPHVYVNVLSNIYPITSPVSLDLGMAGSGGNIAAGAGIGVPMGGSSQLRAEVVFDLVRARDRELIWQAVTASSYSDRRTPEQREMWIEALVRKAFEKFPPEKRKEKRNKKSKDTTNPSDT